MEQWVLEQSMNFCQKVQEIIEGFIVNVNVSYVQVLKSPFVVEFFRLLNEHGMSSSCITIELTESGQVEGTVQMYKVWNHLHYEHYQMTLKDI